MPHILIVDDEEQIREVLRTVLERVGYTVEEAENGNIAVDYCQNHDVDLVVTDIIMPEKGGIDTIMDLRKDFPGVKIIAISGGGMCGDVSYLDMAIGVGADKAIGKPFVLDEFLESVRELTFTEAIPSS
jgi:CheY-like chemotaxis protein